jgi:hypothetical protein
VLFIFPQGLEGDITEESIAPASKRGGPDGISQGSISLCEEVLHDRCLRVRMVHGKQIQKSATPLRETEGFLNVTDSLPVFFFTCHVFALITYTLSAELT